MLKDKAHLLLEKDWRGPNGAKMLSERLFAIFNDESYVFRSPVTITHEGNGPALTVINQTTDGSPPIQEIPVDPTEPGYYPTPTEPSNPGDEPQEPTGGGGGPTRSPSTTTRTSTIRTEFCGTITGGQGKVYTFQLLDADRANDSGLNLEMSATAVITARCVQLHDDETIPNGTFVNPITRLWVVQTTTIITPSSATVESVVTSEQFLFQVPIWL